ncbi:hypothetical protein ES703_44236 [subsurface metagenome]
MDFKSSNTKWFKLILLLLRMVLGWHLLYEGIAKLFTPSWSSYNYLSLSKWIFSDLFHWIASHPDLLKIVDLLNIWGLILIGLGLFLGIFTQLSSLSGIVLLSLYYTANPPFIGMDFGVPVEGHYLIINKTLVEIIALSIFLFIHPKSLPGIDRLISHLIKSVKERGLKSEKISEQSKQTPFLLNRRELLKNLAVLPFFGAFIVSVIRKKRWISYEEKFLKETDAITGATIRTFDFTSLRDLKSKIPHAKIAGEDFSRVILGGNLIGGWAHARDLIYVSKLVKAYFHDEKVFATFSIAEKCGINAFLTNPVLCRVINEYWRRDIGKIKFISDCGGENIVDGVLMSVDNGASACYVHGGIADGLVEEGKMDEIGKALELIRKNGLPAGIGGHKLETIKACVDFGLQPDFWMKTFHHTNYWSADKENQHDNIWCTNPEETKEYMKTLNQPWIAFKILAAGAIHPNVGFRYAFENGADFICVGMYDFQIVDDVNIAADILGSDVKRERPWMA